jgi:ABC-2 type transport system ATP-binding protein
MKIEVPSIEARDLGKSFRSGVNAVSGLDLAVPAGSVFGLIGRNGAGKTTTMRLLMGLLHPDTGRCRVLGEDLRIAAPPTRARVAYVSQEQQLPPWKTLEELALWSASLHPRWDEKLARELAGRFQLPWDCPMGALSGGEHRKASVLQGFAARPEVLLLDEPAAGLDPVARRLLVETIIDQLGEGGEMTVLFSTHLLEDIERVADHVGILERGRMLVSERVEDLQSRYQRLQIIFDDGEVPTDFRLPGTLRMSREGAVVTAVVESGGGLIVESLRNRPGLRVREFPLALQDVFLELLEHGATNNNPVTKP